MACVYVGVIADATTTGYVSSLGFFPVFFCFFHTSKSFFFFFKCLKNAKKNFDAFHILCLRICETV